MRTVFAVFLLFITYVASYPSFREAATNNDENENNFELKLRSILNHLSNEKNDDEHMTRSLASENNYESDDDADDYLFSKRQGGHNIVDKQSKCEIECIYTQRHPQTGKGKSIKDAAKACRQMCPNTSKRRSGNKTGVQKTDKNKKFNQRQLSDDDSSEEQNNQRREFYDFLLDQIQRNNNE
ncbi:unnamed protein product [Rotaria socialis]|uniref:Uncharacterized protein n=1 Tax=Rotaria socialis TaxID=392032 RepID=A0A821B687_9BILA|nr:unnamed protein product [Rotaria socialis]CAF4583968.1 unnamed protein product [Rotaria socialis]